MGLKALTVLQPWAWCIAHAGKTVENRTWAPGSYRGPLAIHAGRTYDRNGHSAAATLAGYVDDEAFPPPARYSAASSRSPSWSRSTAASPAPARRGPRRAFPLAPRPHPPTGRADPVPRRAAALDTASPDLRDSAARCRVSPQPHSDSNRTGFCHAGQHTRCAGQYGTAQQPATCNCPCHTHTVATMNGGDAQ